MEKVIETKTCKCWIHFDITEKDLEFYDKISPIFPSPGSEPGLKKYSIPSPTLCPNCRQQRRLSFRNERCMYKRKCDATGKSIISVYSPDKPFTIYEQSEWWSDRWDPLEYWREFDFSKTFFEQFAELQKVVPRMSMLLVNVENSEYNSYASNLKNCYFVFDSTENENVFYSHNSSQCKNCCDVSISDNLENCYECTNCLNSYKLFQSKNTKNSNNSYYLSDCDWCENCFWCKNLKNKKYHYLNKEKTKEEYDKLMKLAFGDLESFKLEYSRLLGNSINRWTYNSFCENVTGDFLKNCKDTYYGFDSIESEWSKFISNCTKINNSYDYESWAGPSNLCLELNWTMSCNRTAFWIITWVDDSFYCDHCTSWSYLFWCIGLRNAKYCILNKQYTKAEYENLVPKIIEHMKKTKEWWEFFPASISPFWYNETIAMEHYPIERRDVVHNVSTDAEPIFKWSDYENPKPDVTKIIPASKLPKDIADVPDDILNWAIECEVTGKPFRIVKYELDFYRELSLGIPKRHPNQRHMDRINIRNPKRLYDRKCDSCKTDMVTTYWPERQETVYCENCYNKKVI